MIDDIQNYYGFNFEKKDDEIEKNEKKDRKVVLPNSTKIKNEFFSRKKTELFKTKTQINDAYLDKIKQTQNKSNHEEENSEKKRKEHIETHEAIANKENVSKVNFNSNNNILKSDKKQINFSEENSKKLYSEDIELDILLDKSINHLSKGKNSDKLQQSIKLDSIFSKKYQYNDYNNNENPLNKYNDSEKMINSKRINLHYEIEKNTTALSNIKRKIIKINHNKEDLSNTVISLIKNPKFKLTKELNSLSDNNLNDEENKTRRKNTLPLLSKSSGPIKAENIFQNLITKNLNENYNPFFLNSNESFGNTNANYLKAKSNNIKIFTNSNESKENGSKFRERGKKKKLISSQGIIFTTNDLDNEENRELKKNLKVYDSLSDNELELDNESDINYLFYPESKIVMISNVLFLLIIITATIIKPLFYAFEFIESNYMIIMNIFIDFFSITFIFTNFNIIYYDLNDNLVINRREITLKYIKSLFLFDLIFAFIFIINSYCEETKKLYFSDNYVHLLKPKLPFLIFILDEIGLLYYIYRIINLETLDLADKISELVFKLDYFILFFKKYVKFKFSELKYKIKRNYINFTDIEKYNNTNWEIIESQFEDNFEYPFIQYIKENSSFSYQNYSQNFGKITIIIIEILITFHVLSCMYIGIAKYSDDNWILSDIINSSNNMIDESVLHVYISSIYFHLTTIFSIGYGDISSHSIYEKIYNTCIMLFGSILYSIIISYLSYLVYQIGEGDKMIEMHNNTIEDMKLNYKLNVNMVMRLKNFLKFNFNQDQINKHSIYSLLPLSLKRDFLQYVYKNEILNFKFFGYLENNDALILLLLNLNEITLNKYEILLQENKNAEDVFFIKKGKVGLKCRLNLLKIIFECFKLFLDEDIEINKIENYDLSSSDSLYNLKMNQPINYNLSLNYNSDSFNSIKSHKSIKDKVDKLETTLKENDDKNHLIQLKPKMNIFSVNKNEINEQEDINNSIKNEFKINSQNIDETLEENIDKSLPEIFYDHNSKNYLLKYKNKVLENKESSFNDSDLIRNNTHNENKFIHKNDYFNFKNQKSDEFSNIKVEQSNNLENIKNEHQVNNLFDIKDENNIFNENKIENNEQYNNNLTNKIFDIDSIENEKELNKSEIAKKLDIKQYFHLIKSKKKRELFLEFIYLSLLNYDEYKNDINLMIQEKRDLNIKKNNRIFQNEIKNKSSTNLLKNCITMKKYSMIKHLIDDNFEIINRKVSIYKNIHVSNLWNYDTFGEILVHTDEKSPVTLKVSSEICQYYSISKEKFNMINKKFSGIFMNNICISYDNLEVFKNTIKTNHFQTSESIYEQLKNSNKLIFPIEFKDNLENKISQNKKLAVNIEEKEELDSNNNSSIDGVEKENIDIDINVISKLNKSLNSKLFENKENPCILKHNNLEPLIKLSIKEEEFSESSISGTESNSDNFEIEKVKEDSKKQKNGAKVIINNLKENSKNELKNTNIVKSMTSDSYLSNNVTLSNPKIKIRKNSKSLIDFTSDESSMNKLNNSIDLNKNFTFKEDNKRFITKIKSRSTKPTKSIKRKSENKNVKQLNKNYDKDSLKKIDKILIKLKTLESCFLKQKKKNFKKEGLNRRLLNSIYTAINSLKKSNCCKLCEECSLKLKKTIVRNNIFETDTNMTYKTVLSSNSTIIKIGTNNDNTLDEDRKDINNSRSVKFINNKIENNFSNDSSYDSESSYITKNKTSNKKNIENDENLIIKKRRFYNIKKSNTDMVGSNPEIKIKFANENENNFSINEKKLSLNYNPGLIINKCKSSQNRDKLWRNPSGSSKKSEESKRVRKEELRKSVDKVSTKIKENDKFKDKEKDPNLKLQPKSTIKKTYNNQLTLKHIQNKKDNDMNTFITKLIRDEKRSKTTKKW